MIGTTVRKERITRLFQVIISLSTQLGKHVKGKWLKMYCI